MRGSRPAGRATLQQQLVEWDEAEATQVWTSP